MTTVTSPFLKLLEDVQQSMTAKQIVEAAGVDWDDPSGSLQKLKTRLKRDQAPNIDARLVDYILDKTVEKPGLDAAIGALKNQGLTLAQLGILKEIVAQFQLANSPPAAAPMAQVTVDRDVVPGKTITAIDALARPVEERRATINRRDELQVFRIARHETSRFAVPKWLDLAAGPGTEMERSSDYIYFEELKDHKGVHSAVVRGESMTETLKPGDVIVLKEMASGRLELPEIETKEERVSLSSWKRESGLKDGDIAVVSIRNDPPTLKRIIYDTERGEKNWKMQIVADNAREWRHGKPFQVSVGDKIVFHARLIGIAQNRG